MTTVVIDIFPFVVCKCLFMCISWEKYVKASTKLSKSNTTTQATPYKWKIHIDSHYINFSMCQCVCFQKGR